MNHKIQIDGIRADRWLKAYELQNRHQDTWGHFKACELCKTNPSHPSLACPEMRRLSGEEHKARLALAAGVKWAE
jgi:hypothetical protein